MARMKLVLDNEDDKLQFTMTVFDAGYKAALEDDMAGRKPDYETFAQTVDQRAQDIAGVVPHWVDLSDTVTAMQAGDMYIDAFRAGYTQAYRDSTAIVKQLGPYTTDTARLFRDPWTRTWGYQIVFRRQGVEQETDAICGFDSETDAFAHAQKNHRAGELNTHG